MDLNKPKDVLKDLLRDTENDKIKWDVSIEEQFIKATHYIDVTKNKKVTFKLVYFLNHPKGSKLTIIYDVRTDFSKRSATLMDLGGKNKKSEVKDISYLLHKILLKEERYKDVEIFIEDKFDIGDRVVVTKVQEFNGDELGQKGTILAELSGRDKEVLFLIKFDNKFSDIMVDGEFALNTGQTRDGNAWSFKPENIKRIKD